MPEYPSEAADTAVIEEPLVRPSAEPKKKPEEDTKNRTKRQPPYAVIVHDDDLHTYEYVIECLQKVFGYQLEKAFSLTREIDKSGRALVWSGALEVAELKRDQIRNFGDDLYASAPVKFPLGVTIEPLPGD